MVECLIAIPCLFCVEFNNDNWKGKVFKRIENLKFLYESGLYEFLFNEFPGATLFLFGSYSNGDDSANSDIDLAVIGLKERKINLEKFEKMFGKKIMLQFYLSLKDINKNLRENILNGIILKGGVEL